jgi:phytoene dehydrogenase-like protein
VLAWTLFSGTLAPVYSEGMGNPATGGRAGRDIAVVGGGMAGLTAAAYIARAGARVRLFEKEPKVGGLVTTFERGGFFFDGGIRAVESSGIVFPMLRQLGIALEFLPSPVSIGIDRDVIRLSSEGSLADYQGLLERQFPARRDDIAAIVAEVRRVMGYLDVLYGIDNPLFLDLKSDPKYLVRTILPWLLKYALTMPKVARLMLPVDEHLAKLTRDQTLVDIIAQHFFQKTPTYFALSYFTLYLDYRYPRGGTGALPAKMREYALAHGAEIVTGSEIVGVDVGGRTLRDAAGGVHPWSTLVWAADQKALYRAVDTATISDAKARRDVESRRASIAGARGGDSVYTLFLSSRLDPGYFSGIASAHFFYTPSRAGLSGADIRELAPADPSEGAFTRDKARIAAWTRRYLELTTYEVSFPVLRDPSLAPAGMTGLIVSTLTEYALHRHVRDMGWTGEYQRLCDDTIVEVLGSTIFPRLKDSIIDRFSSSPLGLERLTGNTDGAITGWAFTNPVMPAVHDLPAIAKSTHTPIPGVYQAGQWTYSPSGLPISILTGKLAADRVLKERG